MQRNVRIERVLDHPRERVWRAIADAKVLGAWFMPNDLEPTVGHAFTFRKPPERGWDGITHCEVLEVEAPSRIAFSYRGEATGEKAIACAGVRSDAVKSTGKGIFTELDTVLRFRLEPEGDGTRTRLVLEHEGFRGAKLVIVSFIMELGWRKSVLPRLLPVLESMARDERTQAASARV